MSTCVEECPLYLFNVSFGNVEANGIHGISLNCAAVKRAHASRSIGGAQGALADGGTIASARDQPPLKRSNQ